ncbi:DUF1648 domain-containing protein [Alkalicoccobacillus murimartini]|uniref:DUF1648 domain-containing protein n=1 Tax=Alkalicoccobacillus murimartini TaxID=171685 RepID=A0ABT9YC17_9BACI|nr:DUF1648 domain-containing protein [Alkalicoccobacillus murimartini]MDQ0205388.1 hypothetical protein [Alkalicoccobacillus murimartini]
MKFLQFFSWGTLLVFLIHVGYLIYFWPILPAEIPINYGAGGPDSWGSKALLCIMPGIGVVMWLFIHLISLNPEEFNYINLTEENKHLQFKMGRKLSIVVKNCTVLLFIFGNQGMLAGALNESQILPLSLVAISLIGMMSYLFYALFWSATLKT